MNIAVQRIWELKDQADWDIFWLIYVMLMHSASTWTYHYNTSENMHEPLYTASENMLGTIGICDDYNM